MKAAVVKSILKDPRYREMPVIGKGATSLVFARDDGRVEIVTRDPVKVDYLTNSQYADDDYETIDVSGHSRTPAFDEFPVYSIVMDRLLPAKATPESRKMCNDIYKKFLEIRGQVHAECGSRPSYSKLTYEQRMDVMNNDIMCALSELEEPEFEPLRTMADHIGSYWSGDTYNFDISPRNMLYDPETKKIFINDPVVDKKLVHVCHCGITREQKRKQANSRIQIVDRPAYSPFMR